MEHRDRATGWQHAKLSGHENEDLVKIRLDTDEEFAGSLLRRIKTEYTKRDMSLKSIYRFGLIPIGIL